MKRIATAAAGWVLLGGLLLAALPGVSLTNSELAAVARTGRAPDAARALTLMGIRKAPELAEICRSILQENPKGGLLKCALACLGQAGTPEDLSLLRCHLGNADLHVRVVAAASMARLGDVSGEAIILEGVQSSDPLTTKESTYALGFVDTPAARRWLTDILKNPAALWRAYARIAFAEIQLRSVQPEKGRELLVSLCSERSRTISRWAWSRLGKDVPSGIEIYVQEKHDSPVHEALTQHALSSLNHPWYAGTAGTDVKTGAVEEDNSLEETDCARDSTATLNHGYDPVTGGGWPTLNRGTALAHVAETWALATQRFGENSLSGCEGAFQYLGRSVHLLEDMTSPAHVHVDQHPSGDDFETWGDSNYPVGSAALATMQPKYPAAGRAPADFVRELAQFTYERSCFEAVLVESTQPQPDSELKRMFPSLHFHDGGLLGDDYWEIDNIGKCEAVLNEEWWACPGNSREDSSGPGGARRVLGKFYIENAAGDDGNLAPAVWERPLLNAVWTPGKTIMALWGEELYPECVRYASGMLEVMAEEVNGTPVGDLDGDGTVESDDALILAQYLAGRIALDPGQQARADLVADGGLDASDLTELLRRTVL